MDIIEEHIEKSTQHVNCIDDILPQNICSANQNIVINNINITSRELDVIACLIGGRSSKKIASFLLISAKTVENHIRNIMLKFGSTSRESIIDLLEKSEVLPIIKQHYQNIVIRVNFEIELKKISALNKNNNDFCINFFYAEQKNKPEIVSYLENHLSMAGIKISSLHLNLNLNNKLQHVAQSKYVNHIIYSISKKFLEYYSTKVASTKQQLESFKLTNTIDSNSRVVLLLLEKIDSDIAILRQIQKKELITCIDATIQTNYYLLIFEILRGLLPGVDIARSIEVFKKQHEIFFKPYNSIQQILITQKYPETKNVVNEIKYHNKLKIMLIAIAPLIICFLFVVAFNTIKTTESHKIQYTSLKHIDTIASKSKSIKPIEYPIIFNVPPRNSKFIGRNNYLEKISEQLTGKQIGIITQTISGLGGVGKTQLATEFAYRSAEKKHYGAILWINAEMHNSIYDSYNKLAEHLQINTTNLDVKVIQKLIHNHFIETCQGNKILFILDNVQEYKDIKNYLELLHEQLGNKVDSHVLITSRSQNWSDAPLILDNFTLQESLLFIKSHLSNENEDSIVKLAKVFYCFPLALSQAVAYIKTHTNIEEYLAVYTSDENFVLKKFHAEYNEYTEPLWKVCNITLNKLTKNGRKLLFISAYLDPDNIPFDFFKNLTITERMEAIEDLRKHSLVILNSDNKSFKVHRLIQKMVILIEQTSFAKDNWLNNAFDLLEDKFDFNYLVPEKWQSWGLYLPQAIKIAEHSVKKAQNITFERGIKLHAKIAMFMKYAIIGDLIIANDLEKITQMLLNLLELTKNYYKQVNPLLEASIYYHISDIKKMTNILDDAKTYSNKAITIYLEKHSKVTALEKELMNILRLTSFDDSVKLSERIKYDFISTLIMAGTINRYSRDIDVAKSCYNKALTMIDSMANRVVNDSLKYKKIDTLFQLSNIYISLNDLNLAENTLNVMMDLVKKIQDNHRLKGMVYWGLGGFYTHIGKFKESEKKLHEALSRLSIILLNNNPIVNTIKTNIAYNSYFLGDIKKAEPLLIEAITYWDKLNYLCWRWSARLFLARLYEFKNEYDKALQFTRESLIIAKEDCKENLHKCTSTILSRAETWVKINKKDTNINFWRKMLELNIELFGSNHYQTARYHCLLGQSLVNMKQTQQAMLHYKKALAILNMEEIKHPGLVNFNIQNLLVIQELIKECQKI